MCNYLTCWMPLIPVSMPSTQCLCHPWLVTALLSWAVISLRKSWWCWVVPVASHQRWLHGDTGDGPRTLQPSPALHMPAPALSSQGPGRNTGMSSTLRHGRVQVSKAIAHTWTWASALRLFIAVCADSTWDWTLRSRGFPAHGAQVLQHGALW